MYSNLPINFNNSLTLLMCIIFHTAAEVYIVTYLYSPPLTSVYNILGIPYYHQSHCTPLLILINSIVQPVRSFAFSQFAKPHSLPFCFSTRINMQFKVISAIAYHFHVPELSLMCLKVEGYRLRVSYFLIMTPWM